MNCDPSQCSDLSIKLACCATCESLTSTVLLSKGFRQPPLHSSITNTDNRSYIPTAETPTATLTADITPAVPATENIAQGPYLTTIPLSEREFLIGVIIVEKVSV